MVFVYTIKEKVFLGQTFAGEYDPLTGMNGIDMIVMQRYITCAGIPLHGSRKMVKAFSTNTGHPIPVLLWTESMKSWADGMLPLARGAWTKRLCLPILLAALVFFIGWGTYSFFYNTNVGKQQAEYVENPKVGDIILAKVITSYYTDPSMPSSLMVLRIAAINGDSLVVSRSPQQIDDMEIYRIKNKNKLISGFDMSNAAFTGSPEVYNLVNYRQGDERLRRIVLENLNTEERNKQDIFIRNTDIIEPIYVKRPKK